MQIILWVTVVFLVAIAASSALVTLIRRWANTHSVIDMPNERSSHTIPTPRGGGMAIVIIVVTVVLIYCSLTGDWKAGLVYTVGGILIAYIGWRDDRHSLSPRLRFLVHGLTAAGTIVFLGYFDGLPFPFLGRIPLGAAGILLTFIWIVGLTNAFNFMDGIDGIAGGTALTAAAGWMVVAAYGGEMGLPFVIAFATAAASLGFLFHNWSPAKIFMGDVASGFLGYTFAVLPLLLNHHPMQPLMPGILLVWVFIMDAGLTFIRRAALREKLFAAHRSHLYQRMVIAGYSHSDVSLTFALLNTLGLAMSIGWIFGSRLAEWAILAGIPLFWFLFSKFAIRRDMFSRLEAYLSLYSSMGAGWILFRMKYLLIEKSGRLRRQSPVSTWSDLPLSAWLKPGIPASPLAYHEWRRQHEPEWFYRGAPELPANPPWDPMAAVKEAERVAAGEWKYFSHEWIKTGFPPDWHLEPLNKVHFDPAMHWSLISEYGEYDIKYAWEASRLAMVYTLVRAFAATGEQHYAAMFWTLVEDWMEKNQPNSGVNWIGGQEAALRLTALCFGWYAFRGTPATTAEHTAKLTCLAGALGQRIWQNLPFAIHTRNNHSISEAFGLWLCCTIFPELKVADRYRETGRRVFIQQVKAQFFDDGGYSMYSLNYQRLVLQVAALALRLGEIHDCRFPQEIYTLVGKAASLLETVVQPGDGNAPMSGSNDGALVYPMDNCDFRDYRPVLQLACYAASRQRALPPGEWDEGLFWLYGAEAVHNNGLLAEKNVTGQKSFPRAGIYCMEAGSTRVYVRCVQYRNRPSHADQLHVDLWHRGVNLAMDAGTYLYHGPAEWQNGLAGTGVHNTVTMDGADQMARLSRFTWGKWANGRVKVFNTEGKTCTFTGSHKGYSRPGDPVEHLRTVQLFQDEQVLVVDRLKARQAHTFRCNWLLMDLPYTLVGVENGMGLVFELKHQPFSLVFSAAGGSDVDLVHGSESLRGWQSWYYGEKHPVLSLQLACAGRDVVITTQFIPGDFRVSHPNLLAGWSAGQTA